MKKVIFLYIFLALFSLPLLVQAGVLDGLGCLAKGTCGLSDIEIGFQLITNWLLTTIGALALLYFIWGAIQWITSYGKSDKVEHGKDIMIGSVTAAVIALISYILIQFFINDVLLGGQNSEYQVSSECVGATQNQVCNDPLRNYVCTGTFTEPERKVFDNLCVTRCQLKNMVGDPGNWSCVPYGSFIDHPGLGKFNDGCPTDDEICVNTDTFQRETYDAPTSTAQGGGCRGARIAVNPAQCNDASNGLSGLIGCLRQNLGDNFVISSISDDNAVGDLDRCQGNNYTQPPCDHRRNSCHYGGVDQQSYSCAVDLVAQGNITPNNLLTVARDICGAQYALNEGSHVHASVSGCGCDGHE